MTTARIGAAIVSEKNSTEGRGMAIDILRIILVHEGLYERGKQGVRATLCSVMKTCIQVAALREAAVCLYASILAHPDGVAVLINLKDTTASDHADENYFVPRLVVLLDAEISKGEQRSVHLLREAVMILSAISKQVALVGLLRNLRVLFSQATSKLMADPKLTDILPTISALLPGSAYPVGKQGLPADASSRKCQV